MAYVRINLALTTAQAKKLDRLAGKWELDRTNTLRHCLARAYEQEFAKPKGEEREQR